MSIILLVLLAGGGEAIGPQEADVAASPSGNEAAEPSRRWLGEIESKGEVAFESRAFRDDGLAQTHDAAAGLMGRVEWRHQQRLVEQKLRAYGRVDQLDRGRSVLVVEEAFVQLKHGRLRLRLGADIVNWTATEVFHPADVLNARNLDSDLESLEKVGEPMAAVQVGLWEGMTASAYVMPVYMKTLFPSPGSRLNVAPGVDLRQQHVLVDRRGNSTDAHLGPQAALRLSQVIGSADVSVHGLEQMDRLQPLVGFEQATGRPVPVFLTVQQLGGTYQQAVGALVVKVEAAYRRFFRPLGADGTGPYALPDDLDRNHGAVAVGIEYGLIHSGGAESTLLLEGQTLLGVRPAVRQQLSPFQRDVFGGYRLALGDEDSKELTVGGIFDLERPGELLVNVAYQQRLGETFSLRVGLRLFAAPGEAPGGLAPWRDADHLRLTLTRHF